MLETKSFGAVLYRKVDNRLEYLLLKHANGGHWSLCKGHAEGKESEQETALREIWEETGLVVRLNKRFRSVIAYSPYEGVHKTVVFFLAKTKKKKLRLQKDEILNSVWLEYEDALKLLIHHDVGGVLYQAHTFLAEKARSSRS